MLLLEFYVVEESFFRFGNVLSIQDGVQRKNGRRKFLSIYLLFS